MDSIYLDHNATTPIHPDVVEAMRLCYSQALANPASQHRPGQQTRKLLEDARERIAEILGAQLYGPQADRLIFTGSATQANNLAILGIARASGPEPGQVIISAAEHSSVIEPAEYLLEHGWDYDGLPVTPQGVVRAEMLPGLLTDKARLVSVSLGNHETGVLQPVARLAEMCNQAGVLLHTDAVQVVGKLPVAFRALGVAAMTIGAHKFRGPVGIGALILRHDVKLEPLCFGGPHEQALWPGTPAVVLAVGMCTALELWQREHEAHLRHLTALRDRFEASLRAAAPEVIVHGSGAERLPQTSSVAFPGVDAQMMLLALDSAGVACSVGAACSSGSTELSPTLRAMGLPTEIVAASLRFSFGATNTLEEIDEAVRRIVHVYGQLRA